MCLAWLGIRRCSATVISHLACSNHRFFYSTSPRPLPKVLLTLYGTCDPLLTYTTTGVDVICAQGGEGGGHTGDTPFSILIPAVVDICKNAKSPLTGDPVIVVAAGGIADGRGLAAALSYVPPFASTNPEN